MTPEKSPIVDNFILNSPSGKFIVENNYNLLNEQYSQTKNAGISLSQPTLVNIVNTPTTGNTFKRSLFRSESSNKGKIIIY